MYVDVLERRLPLRGRKTVSSMVRMDMATFEGGSCLGLNTNTPKGNSHDGAVSDQTEWLIYADL